MAVVKRPKSIRIAVGASFVPVLLSFLMIFMPSIKRMGDFIPMIFGIITTLQFVSLIGIWHMKRWGVHLFLIMFCIRIITYVLLDMYTFGLFFGIFYSIIVIVFLLIHYRKMDTNL